LNPVRFFSLQFLRLISEIPAFAGGDGLQVVIAKAQAQLTNDNDGCAIN
jgi:hypothetical protein